ncbi:MAG: thermonuclease family protein [Candidatus Melainabacteria bacterium]|nr:thermonuclease family protein [Candidatus Melainabacteria bacterium]
MRVKLKNGLLISVLTAMACSTPPALAASFSAKVVSVVDGDTFKVQLSDTRATVILYGIDCPEPTQEYGEEAKKFTNENCFGKVVSIDLRGKDKMGRLIAVVSLADGTNLNQELVNKGLAWWSDKFAPKDELLKRFQSDAKTARRGLWSASNPVPPWIFRNGEKSVGATILSK